MQDLPKDWKGGSGSLFSCMPDSPDFTGKQDGGEDNNTVNFEFCFEVDCHSFITRQVTRSRNLALEKDWELTYLYRRRQNRTPPKFFLAPCVDLLFF